VHWQGTSEDFLQQTDAGIKAYLGENC